MHEQLRQTTQPTIIVGVELQKDTDFHYSMEELNNLADALDLQVVGQLTQKLPVPNQATYIGAGKASELSMMCESLEATLVVFNDELSPSQIRNLEKLLEVTVYDRTMLILDIFGERAKTKEAQLQVEMARLHYLLPRLVGMRASLSRQGGSGTGLANRGAGETKLELDRRKIEARIHALEKELEDVVKRRELQRKRRKKQAMPVVALVGYTNAGKSSLMNTLLDNAEEKSVFEKDMLFATLDTSVRKVELDKNHSVLLADTVGFVSKLPTHLVKAFRSTLEEAREADLLLHVVDYSNERHREMANTTNETLQAMEIDRPMIYVYNKMDRLKGEFPQAHGDELFISAKAKQGLDLLAQKIASYVFQDFEKHLFIVPYCDGEAAAYLNNYAHVHTQRAEEDGWHIVADLHERDLKRVESYCVSKER
ncbi:GTPase HflX [Shouchella tritolerans]|uniref:GTPase HflX n=1 Tax=Shouchella tritolerans TaxID=2979466 RepID=UPI0021E7D0FE|nr:GTPase HflX [Shouchella tritolerans]